MYSVVIIALERLFDVATICLWNDREVHKQHHVGTIMDSIRSHMIHEIVLSIKREMGVTVWPV